MLGYSETTARAVYRTRLCRAPRRVSPGPVAGLQPSAAASESWCLLFADVENPTSMALYRRIGFADVCLYREYRFT
jgi:hypothetical protein